MSPKTKKPSWKSSDGKALLERDIRHGVITSDMDYEAVFMMRTEFCVGVTPEEALRLFEGRLKAALNRNTAKDDWAEDELALLRQDRQTHPRPAFNYRGEPQWEGSEAQRLLKQDVAAKVHEGKTPTQFHGTRPEYQQFPINIIAGKIKQEVWLQKFLSQMRN